MGARRIGRFLLGLALAGSSAALAADYKVVPGGAVPPRPLYDEMKVEQVLALLKQLDAQVAKGFETAPDLRKKMEQDMAAIEKMKPGKERDAAIARYQAKHAPGYRGVLKAGGVDLDDFARNLEKIQNAADAKGVAPLFQVSARVVDGAYIVAEAKQSELTGTMSGPNDPPPAPPPAPEEPVASQQQALSGDGSLTRGEYQDAHDRHCALFGFGDNIGQDNWILSETTSAMAGGCDVSMTRSATVIYGGAQPATLTMSGEVLASGSAGGIAGTAFCSSYASATDGTNSVSSSIFVLAPVLFLATAEQLRPVSLRLPLAAGAATATPIRYSTYAFSVASGPISVAGCRGTAQRIFGRIM